MPVNAMSWIAAWFPLLSFAVGFVLYALIKRAWVATLLVFGATFGAMWRWFDLRFWPWLLMYLFLCWFGSWVAHYTVARRSRSAQSASTP